MKAKPAKPVKLIAEDLQGNGYHVFVNVTVNGVKCRFLVDTGASKSVVDRGFYEKRFGRRNVKTIKQQTTGLHSSTSESYIVPLRSLVIGHIPNKKYTVALVDLNHVNKTYAILKKKRIQGILGSDLMMKDKMVIDYGRMHIHFS